jgi:hypothetical protein
MAAAAMSRPGQPKRSTFRTRANGSFATRFVIVPVGPECVAAWARVAAKSDSDANMAASVLIRFALRGGT